MNRDDDLVAIVRSTNNVIIRITKERWEHIITRHPLEEHLSDILTTITTPEMIFVPPEGYPQQKLAIKSFKSFIEKGLALNLTVHYKELPSEDGFLITAFVISQKRLERMMRKWKKVYP